MPLYNIDGHRRDCDQPYAENAKPVHDIGERCEDCILGLGLGLVLCRALPSATLLLVFLCHQT